MPYRNRYVRNRLIFCLSMALLAGFLQSLWRDNTLPGILCGRFSIIIYIFLLCYWMRSIKRRILHRRFVKTLSYVCNLLMFWLILREVRYVMFLDVPLVTHYAWYLYYIPQILIPMLGFFCVDLIGKEEEHHVSRELYILWIPALFLMGLVLSNDYHQLVWSFDEVLVEYDRVSGMTGIQSWNMGYVMILAWIFSLLLGAILLLYSRSTLTVSKNYALVPVVIFLSGVTMCILELLGLQDWYRMPEMYSITYVLSFESCIEIGLIPSNTNYEWFFRTLKVPARLVDPSGKTAYVSGYERKIEELHGPGWKLKDAKVDGGTVYWAEDVREISKLKHYLEEAKEQLSENFHLLEAESELEEHRIRTEEKGRLFDTLSSFTNSYIDELEELIERAEQEEDPTDALGRACLLTTYIKRRSNLMLISGTERQKGSTELNFCIQEFVLYMNLHGIHASFVPQEVSDFTTEEAILVFDHFALIIHRVAYLLRHLFISIDANEKEPCLRMIFDGDLSVEDFPEYEVMEEDGSIYLSIPLREGGF